MENVCTHQLHILLNVKAKMSLNSAMAGDVTPMVTPSARSAGDVTPASAGDVTLMVTPQQGRPGMSLRR